MHETAVEDEATEKVNRNKPRKLLVGWGHH